MTRKLEELSFTLFSNYIYKKDKLGASGLDKSLVSVGPCNFLDIGFDEWRRDVSRANYVENYIFCFYGCYGHAFPLIDWKQREWEDDKSIKNLKPAKKEKVTFVDLEEN